MAPRKKKATKKAAPDVGKLEKALAKTATELEAATAKHDQAVLAYENACAQVVDCEQAHEQQLVRCEMAADMVEAAAHLLQERREHLEQATGRQEILRQSIADLTAERTSLEAEQAQLDDGGLDALEQAVKTAEAAYKRARARTFAIRGRLKQLGYELDAATAKVGSGGSAGDEETELRAVERAEDEAAQADDLLAELVKRHKEAKKAQGKASKSAADAFEAVSAATEQHNQAQLAYQNAVDDAQRAADEQANRDAARAADKAALAEARALKKELEGQ